jgi:drug/metabolite transporter (DMT)-like permease
MRVAAAAGSLLFIAGVGQNATFAWTIHRPLTRSRIDNRTKIRLIRPYNHVGSGCSRTHQLHATTIDEINDVITTTSRGDIEGTSLSLAPQPQVNSSNQATLVDVTGIPKQVVSFEDGVESNAYEDDNVARQTYQRGIATVGFITVLFASNSPVLHSAFTMTSSHNPPPVLLINAAVTVVGCLGVLLISPFLGKFVPDPSKKQTLTTDDSTTFAVPFLRNFIQFMGPTTIAGAELGLWKTLGTTANIWGLSQTSADHGAFLIQLTTLIVPTVQGLSGVPIPSRIWAAIGLALGGVLVFTQDPSQSDCASLQGDLLCVLAAIFYATYDLRLFKWGKLVATNELIGTKMVTQSVLSLGLLLLFGREGTLDFFSKASTLDLELVGVVALWSGLAVNCLAPYLQVSGQQAVGPSRAQIIYASQPLWAAVMGFYLLGERIGTGGLLGGSAFLGAILLAATAELPDPQCPADECEV